jgi:phosphoglucosamine mutase
MAKLFGTDGIRAVAGQFPLNFSSVCILGEALVELLQEEGLPTHVIIGRDTRESGKWLEQALFQGIRIGGGEAVSGGVIPTSAVSFLTKTFAFSAGIVISASHNPYQDNGIKIFSPEGMKIPEAWEERLENAVRGFNGPIRPESIQIRNEPVLEQKYMEFVTSRFAGKGPNRTFKIVLDCSNGASSNIAPRIFQELGYDAISLNASPDGKNINKDCGSLYPQELAKHVVENGADMGIAYDGDADRAIWVDEKGRILNGDHTLFVQGRFMHERGLLKSDSVVATTMSNMGLEKAFQKMKVKLIRTQVGDKFVLDEMIKSGANLGGEQSGHTIFLDDIPTGDGILTSIKMLEVLDEEKASLSELVKDFQEYPQVHLNVAVSRKEDFKKYPQIVSTINEIESHLGNRGRFQVRYSGTEPLVRIMAEGQDKKELEELASRMATILSNHLS